MLLVTSSSSWAANALFSRVCGGNAGRYAGVTLKAARFCGISLDMAPLPSSPTRMQLPPSAMEFCRVLGLGATLRLADCAKPDHRDKRRAGYRIRIPMGNIPDEHPLVRTLGRDGAEVIHRAFAGETMAFPAKRVRAIRRDIEIAKAFEQGVPIPALADTHGVSLRTVTRALDRVTGGDIARAGGLPPPPGLVPSRDGPMRV